MPYGPITCTFRSVVGTRYFQGGSFGPRSCSGGHAQPFLVDGEPYFYNHMVRVECPPWDRSENHIDYDWLPGKCDRCDYLYEAGSPVERWSGSERVYDTEDGKLHPGDLYWASWYDYSESDKDWTWDCGRPRPGDLRCATGRWSNCDGRHLMAVCPNDHHWDVDSRASNCGSPDDTVHRCWVRHGDPPAPVHVDKAGPTCTAGAGSIVAGDYHGFLHDNAFTAG